MRSLVAVVALFLPVPALSGQAEWWQIRHVERMDHAAAFDTHRGQLLVLGGIETAPATPAGTVIWDGTRWLWPPLAADLPPRRMAAAAYDEARDRVVVFGGYDAQFLGDLWEWDGAGWTAVPVAAGPTARDLHAMVYDAARGVTVLFGGWNGTALADTWEWNGMSWTQRITAGGPPGMMRPAMAYDRARNVTVLYDVVGRATWTWNGSAWSQVATNGPPLGTNFVAAAYDETRQRVVVVADALQPWEWNGSSWTQVNAAPPVARTAFSLTWDRDRSQVVLFGGFGQLQAAEQWLWNGATWTAVPKPPGPPRADHRMAYDAVRARCVLASGPYSVAAMATWEWDGFGWIDRGSGPPGRQGHGLAYDIGHARTVLFGGRTSGGLDLDDTWEWDGSLWTQANPASRPPARSRAALAHDSGRGRTVLFGGIAGNAVLGDTWEWDGTSWSAVAATGPTARLDAAMAWDSIRGQTVLFGGAQGGTLPQADTWSWNGVSWQQVAATGPGARMDAALYFDHWRALGVLSGGRDPTTPFGTFHYQDTWEWDGAAWHARAAIAPSPQLAVAYDLAQQRAVAVLSFSGNALPLGDYRATWFHGVRRAAAVTSVGNGCAGSTGVPVLTSDMPDIGDAAYRLAIVGAPGGGLCAFGVAFRTAATPVGGGCTLHLAAPVFQVLGVLDARGRAALGMPLPADPAFLGVTLHAQGAAIDPAAPAGFTVTRALEIRLGR